MDRMKKLENIFKDNNFSIYDILSFGRYKQITFLNEIFGENQKFNNEKINKLKQDYIDFPFSFLFDKLEEDVTKNQYCIIYYFKEEIVSKPFDDVVSLIDWINSNKYADFICLIINGKILIEYNLDQIKKNAFPK